jgi:tRNA(fMet)-specific endonuclease VapC
MPGRLLLDTSFVVDLFHGDPAAQRRTADAEEVFLSTVALGELYYGAERSDRKSELMAQVDGLAASTDRSSSVCGPKAGLSRRTTSGSRPSRCSTILSS